MSRQDLLRSGHSRSALEQCPLCGAEHPYGATHFCDQPGGISGLTAQVPKISTEKTAGLIKELMEVRELTRDAHLEPGEPYRRGFGEVSFPILDWKSCGIQRHEDLVFVNFDNRIYGMNREDGLKFGRKLVEACGGESKEEKQD